MSNTIPIDKILPNPEQPRTEFDADELDGLAGSIRELGVIQPITVEWAADGYYILHDGERRLRAARLAGLSEIPAMITPPLNGTGAQDRLLRALVANTQRSDLNPVEEARAYQRLRELGLSQVQISLRLGVHVARVGNALLLLELDEPIQELIEQRKLQSDNRLVRALKSIPQQEARIQTARKIAGNKPTIAQAMKICRKVTEHLADADRDNKAMRSFPALHLATRKAGESNQTGWNALAQVGSVPPWLLVELGAEKTCKGCALYDSASQIVCAECPLVYFLALLIGKANHEQ